MVDVLKKNVYFTTQPARLRKQLASPQLYSCRKYNNNNNNNKIKRLKAAAGEQLLLLHVANRT